jgi:hypothetical protein
VLGQAVLCCGLDGRGGDRFCPPLGLYSWGFPRKHRGCGISFLFLMTHFAYVVGDFVKYTLYCSVICFYIFCYVDFIFLVKVNLYL